MESLFDEDCACVSCGGKITAGGLKVAADKMCHQACISDFITPATPPHVLITIARLNNVSWASLVKHPVTCAYCQGGVVDNPVVMGTGIVHTACFCVQCSEGKITPEVAKQVVTDNGLSTAKVGALISIASRIKQASVLDTVKAWLSGIYSNLVSASASYDATIAALERLLEAPTTAMRKRAVGEDLTKDMKMLEALEIQSQANELRIKSIMESYGMDKIRGAVGKATSRVIEYLSKFQAKQVKLQNTLYRVSEGKTKKSFSGVDFRDALYEAYKNNQAVTDKLKEVEAACTKLPVDKSELEIVLNDLSAPIPPAPPKPPAPPAASVKPASPTGSGTNEGPFYSNYTLPISPKASSLNREGDRAEAGEDIFFLEPQD